MRFSRVSAAWDEFLRGEGIWVPSSGLSAIAREEADEALLQQVPEDARAEYARMKSNSQRRQWAEARRCELEVESRLLAEQGTPEKPLLSVTHAARGEETRVVVVGVGAVAGACGVGVDLEFSGRALRNPESLRKSLVTPDEESRVPFLSVLELWVIKEACFKANSENSNTIIADYRIIEFDRGSGSGKAVLERRKGLSISFRLLSVEDELGNPWWLAFAVSFGTGL